MLSAILFDLDDTLLDWSGFKADWGSYEQRHLRGVFDHVSQHVHALDDFALFASEFRNRTQAAWVAARSSLRAPNVGALLLEAAVACGAPADKLDMRACLEAYRWGPIEGTQLFPEVLDVLRQVREAGIRTGIVTNAGQPMWMRDLELAPYGILDYFPSCRISAADVGYLKPHPTIFQQALTCVGAKPEETIFVGDDVNADIVGAQSAGIKAVLRATRHNAYLDGSVKPDAIINALTELPALCDGWFPGWRM